MIPRPVARAGHIEAGTLPGPVPSQRTVGNYLREARRVPAEEQRRYREASWPASFGGADLPWQSAALLREVVDFIGHRPLARNLTWLWRTTLARPDSSLLERWRVAGWLALAEARPDRRDAAQLAEDWLMGSLDLSAAVTVSGADDRALEALLGYDFRSAWRDEDGETKG